MSEESTLERKIRERREARESAAPTVAPALSIVPSEYADLIPDEDTAYARSDADLTIDGLIDGLDILKAYDMYIPKPRPPQSGNKREGIMVRCPRPDHNDNNPSAWINTDTQLWYCASCAVGGDKLDLASFNFGMGDYKTGKRFGELREKIASSLGYSIVRSPGVTNPTVIPNTPAPAPVPAPPTLTSVPAPAPAPAPTLAVAPEPAPSTEGSDSNVTQLFEDINDDIILPTIDWRPLVVEGTFLDSYMKQCIQDDAPEEYHFWNGLLAISMACGRDVVLADQKPVLGNLFMCIIGKSGMGKSRSLSHLKELVETALPYDWSDPMDRGAKTMHVPGSGEVLIHQFSRPIPDPSNPKVIKGYAPVRGLVDFDELSNLTSRANRQGSSLKTTIMQFFDGATRISSTSLSSGSQIAEHPYACVTASVQPKALSGLVSDTDAVSGFLNRWVFVTGTPKKRIAVGGVTVDIKPCLKPLQNIHEWAYGRGAMPWSAAALEEFTTFFDNYIDPLQLKDDTDLFTRIDLLCKKLCLLLSANELLDEVSLDVVLKVEAIFVYLCAIWNVQAENLGDTEERRCEKRILEVISKQGSKQKDGAVPIYLIVKLMEKKFSSKMIIDALTRLASLDKIDSYTPPQAGPGRPSKPRYKLVSNAE